MNRFANLFLILIVAVLATGCAGRAPPYSVSIDNVQNLKDSGRYTAAVGKFTSNADPDNFNPLTIRASSMSSPYQDSYANYLSEAIKQELSLADKLAPGSNIEISGVLLKNKVNAAGFETGYGDVQARFIVKNRGEVRYDQIKTAHHEWESSFAGNIAIPRAGQEYPILIQKLLTSLYSDKAFFNALK